MDQDTNAMDKARSSQHVSSAPSPIQIYLAPMEGVVDHQIREILTSFGGIDVCATEFIRVTQFLNPEHVFYKFAPELKNKSKTLSHTPVFIQLLGSDLNCMAENAQFACELGAHGIDINFGCPAKTVNRHDGGSVILKNPERVLHITQAVRKAVPADIPVTTKVRLGFEHKDFHKEIALAAQEAGSSRLVVHARTKLEAYKPPAHWEYIAAMKETVSMPVVANGDIWTVEDYLKCREVSGCSDVMLGRGLMAQPLLALQIRKALKESVPDTFSALNAISDSHEESSSRIPLDAPEFQNPTRPNELDRFYIRHFVLRYYELSTTCPEHMLIGRLKQLIKLLSRHSLFFQNMFEQIKRHREIHAILNHLELSLKLFI